MKRLDDKGFMLVEALIVGVFIISTLTYLYVQFKTVNDNYERSFTYNEVNQLYALKNIGKYLLASEIYGDLVTSLESSSNGFIEWTCPSDGDINTNYCKGLFDSLDINTDFKIIFTEANLIPLRTILNNSANNELLAEPGYRSFIKYIKNDEQDGVYRIIAKFKDDSFATVLISEVIEVGDSGNGNNEGPFTFEREYAYNGGIQELIVPKTGVYNLEAWGAQGGVRIAAGSTNVPYGAYSKGEVTLNAGETIYIVVGGAGGVTASPNVIINGGYNGGGKGYSYNDGNRGGASGGGATHFALNTGLLSSLSSNKTAVLLVAGGGGASANCCTGYTKVVGGGGGITGGASRYYQDSNGAVLTSVVGATQTSAAGTGAFGQGANCTSVDCGGGGGGYYGGGFSVGGGGYGSGGSGFIAHERISNGLMVCYNCTASSETTTLTQVKAEFSAEPVANKPKGGDGYAKITFLREN